MQQRHRNGNSWQSKLKTAFYGPLQIATFNLKKFIWPLTSREKLWRSETAIVDQKNYWREKGKLWQKFAISESFFNLCVCRSEDICSRMSRNIALFGNTFWENLPGLRTNISIHLKLSSISNLFPGTTIFSLNEATCSFLPLLSLPLQPFTIFQQEYDEIFCTPVRVKPLKSKDWLICWN